LLAFFLHRKYTRIHSAAAVIHLAADEHLSECSSSSHSPNDVRDALTKVTLSY